MRGASIVLSFVLGLLTVSNVFQSSVSAQQPDDLSYLEDSSDHRTQAWISKQNERTLSDFQYSDEYRWAYRTFPRHQTAVADVKNVATASVAGAGVVFGGFLYHQLVTTDHPRGLWQRISWRSYLAGNRQWQLLLDVDAYASRNNRAFAQLNFTPDFCRPRGDRCIISLMDTVSGMAVFKEFDLNARAFVEGGFQGSSPTGCCVWEDDDTLLMDRGIVSAAPDYTSGARMLHRWRRGQKISDAKVAYHMPPSSKPAILIWAPAILPAKGQASPRSIIFQLNSADPDGRFSSRYILWRSRMPLPLNLPESALIRGVMGNEIIIQLQDDFSENGGGLVKGALVSITIDEALRPLPIINLVKAPRDRESLDTVQVTRDALLVLSTSSMRGELSRYRRSKGGWSRTLLNMPSQGAIGPAILGNSDERDALVAYSDFLNPPLDFVVRHNEQPVRRSFGPLPLLDPNEYVIRLDEAVSADGTRVPYYIGHRANLVRDGSAPTLVEAYGAFGTSLPPVFNEQAYLWLARGGVFVLAAPRGGGELGRGWHVVRDGRRATYEDIRAVLQKLSADGITSPKHLGIWGHSAGGLLAAVVATQQADLVNAAVLSAPVTDLFRTSLLVGGNLAIDDEFGRATVANERAFLASTSPYQQLRRGMRLPFPLLLSSTRDQNVLPGQPRRFAARAAELGLPVYYYETVEGGHALAATPDQRAALGALIHSYLAQRLGPFPSIKPTD